MFQYIYRPTFLPLTLFAFLFAWSLVSVAGSPYLTCRLPSPQNELETPNIDVVVISENENIWKTALNSGFARASLNAPQTFNPIGFSVKTTSPTSNLSKNLEKANMIVVATEEELDLSLVNDKVNDILVIDRKFISELSTSPINKDMVKRAGEHIAIISAMKAYKTKPDSIIELDKAHLISVPNYSSD